MVDTLIKQNLVNTYDVSLFTVLMSFTLISWILGDTIFIWILSNMKDLFSYLIIHNIKVVCVRAVSEKVKVEKEIKKYFFVYLF